MKSLALYSFLFCLVPVSQTYSQSFSTYLGLAGGTTRVVAAQNQFAWDFHAKAGIWTTYFDLGLNLGGVGVETKTDPITGKASSGVTTVGGAFQEVPEEVTYNIFLIPLEAFLTLKLPTYQFLSITATFAVGYLLDINTRGGFLDALGATSLPATEATPIETRNTVLFQGYSLAGLVGIEMNFSPLIVFTDVGYRYAKPEITTDVPETTTNSAGVVNTSVVSKTYEQNVSGLIIRGGIKFLL